MAEVRVIHGDCLEVIAGMESGLIDLILTSPPYDNLRVYRSGSAFDFEGVAAQCTRILKLGGVLVWVVGDETRGGDESGTSFRQALHFKSLGLRLNDTMIYCKSNPRPATESRPRYMNSFEFMFVLSKGRPVTFNPLMEPCMRAGSRNLGTFRPIDGNLRRTFGDGRPVKPDKIKSNVWTYGVGGDDYGHPAVFPLQLAIDHILSWTNPGDVVLDPFVGSGTTLDACVRTGRVGIGIEKDAGYCEIARRRLAGPPMPLFDVVSSVPDSTPLFAGIED